MNPGFEKKTLVFTFTDYNVENDNWWKLQGTKGITRDPAFNSKGGINVFYYKKYFVAKLYDKT